MASTENMFFLLKCSLFQLGLILNSGRMIGIEFTRVCFLAVYQERSSGKDGGVAVPEEESTLEEAGAMDAVLVNTHQVSFII